MKRLLIMMLISAIATTVRAEDSLIPAGKTVFKVIDSHCGSKLGLGETVWSKAKLKASRIEIDQDSLTLVIFNKNKVVESYKLQDEFENNNSSIVQAHDIMTGQGWVFTDFVAVNECDHKNILRLRKHSVQDKLQLFVYRGLAIYAYDLRQVK